MDSSQTLITTANQYLRLIAISPEGILAALADAPDEQRFLVVELARIVAMSDEIAKAQTLCELVEQRSRLRTLLASEPGAEIDPPLYISPCALDREHQPRPPVLDNPSLEYDWRRLCLAYYGLDPGLSRLSNDDRLPPDSAKEKQR